MITEIKCCRICKNTDLIPILDLGNHVLSGRFPFPNEADPPQAPLVLVKCNDSKNSNYCGLLQLLHTVQSDELYFHNYGYRSGLNNTMTTHLRDLAKEIESRLNLGDRDIILDIGSNDCTLLKAYSVNSNTNVHIQKIGIDPTGKQFIEFYPKDIELVADFFTEQNFRTKFPTQSAKVITSISMFYDLPDPVQFMKDVKACLAPDGIWVAEQSYLLTMLEKNSFDTICHEHLEYYSYKQIEWMANKVGLKIIDITLNDCNGGSFRITFAHLDSEYRVNTENIQKIIDMEFNMELYTMKPYQEFYWRCEEEKRKLVKFLHDQKAIGKTIYLYGASTKGNTLLQYYGLDHTIISGAAERNQEKIGRRTPATNIPIISEDEMRQIHPDFLLVLPWHFKKEFLEREKAYLELGGQYIFPLPNVDIVSARKKVFITGINGQIGQYLYQIIREHNSDFNIYGLTRKLPPGTGTGHIFYIEGDLDDLTHIKQILYTIKPDIIYNLAGITDALVSIERPEAAVTINGNIALTICEFIKNVNREIRYFQASSSELFKGLEVGCFDETNINFYPKNPYALGKLLAHWTVRHYREVHGLYCCNGIIFNTESPLRRDTYVTRKITKAVASIKLNKQKTLSLGNLNSMRDWIHAHDAANAIYMLMNQTNDAGDYIIASNKTYSIQDFVEKAFKEVGTELVWSGDRLSVNYCGKNAETGEVLVTIDPKYFRGYEGAVQNIRGDNSKLLGIGWKPQYDIDSLVKDMVDHDMSLIKYYKVV